MPFKVRTARLADAPAVALLFDAYRVFYRKPTDSVLARRFITARLKQGDSYLLIAEADGLPLGFVQLYPSFSSVAAAPILILNDLFVAPKARKLGLGRALMRAARKLAEKKRCARLDLATEVSNRVAQALYESEGYVRNTGFRHYSLNLG